MGTKANENEIIKRLDQILKILGIVLTKTMGEETSLTEKAVILKRGGLDNYVIAEILNSTPESVRKLIANYPPRIKKKKG